VRVRADDPTIAFTVGVVLVLAIAVPAVVILLFRNGWRVLPLAIGTIAGLIVGAALDELHRSGLAPRLGTLEHDIAGLDQKLDAIKKALDDQAAKIIDLVSDARQTAAVLREQPTRPELQKAFADARQDLDEKLRPLASGSELNPLRGMLEVLEKHVKAFKSQLDRSSLDKLAERLQMLEAAVAKAPSKDDLKQFPTKDDLTQLATKVGQLPTKDDLGEFATKEDLNKARDAVSDKLKPPPVPPSLGPAPEPPQPPNIVSPPADIIIGNVRPAWGNSRPVVWVTLQARSGAPARLIDGNIRFCPANGATPRPDDCPPASTGNCGATLTCGRAQIRPGWSQELCATIPPSFAQDPNVGFTLRGELRLSDGAGTTFNIPLAYDTPLTATPPPGRARINLRRASGCGGG
jgi:hypothetical protein